MDRNEPWSDIGSVFLGVIGGMALAEILKNILQKKCSFCNNLNESNQDYCKFCGGKLN